MNNLDKDTRNIIILLIIFFLILGIYLINKLLVVSNNEVLEDIGDNSKFVLINSTDDFRLYTINNLEDEYNLYINDVNIKYINNELYLNDTYVDSYINLINYIGFYKDRIVLFINNNIAPNQYVYMYNPYTNESDIIDKIDDMHIANIESASISEAGINIYLSNIIDNKLYINNNTYDICEYDKDITVGKNIIYFYDYDLEDFNDREVIETIKLKEYKKDIC